MAGNKNRFSLGRLEPTPGTPLNVFDSFPQLTTDDSEQFVCNVTFQADKDNTGAVYIGDDTLDVSSKAGIIYVLVWPGDAYSETSMALNTIDLRVLWVDTESAGDGVYISVAVR
jgi:hypothetical protein